MSIPLAVARTRAENAARQLREVAARVEIVGSVRRQRPRCKDIELLVEPRMVEDDLFGGEAAHIEPVRRLVLRWGDVVRANGDRLISVVSGPRGRLGAQWDVFLCHPPADWGVLLAIRTGPAHLSRLCVTRLREKGWRCKDGQVWRPWGGGDYADAGDPDSERWRSKETRQLGGDLFVRVPCPVEEDFFRACEVPCVPPERRDGVQVEPLAAERLSRDLGLESE